MFNKRCLSCKKSIEKQNSEDLENENDFELNGVGITVFGPHGGLIVSDCICSFGNQKSTGRQSWRHNFIVWFHEAREKTLPPFFVTVWSSSRRIMKGVVNDFLVTLVQLENESFVLPAFSYRRWFFSVIFLKNITDYRKMHNTIPI